LGDPAPPHATGELGKRLASALVLAALAIGADVLGGWPFVLFWAAAAVGVFWEWYAMAAGADFMAVRRRRFTRVALCAGLVCVAVFVGGGMLASALSLLAVYVVLAATAGDPRHQTWAERGWRGAGVVYAGILLFAPVVLRRDGQYGLVAILFLFAVVWSTDIFGYFVGRAIGGPRLARVISPNKTWSGACGGVLGAVASGVAVAFAAGGITLLPAAAVAFALSVASQAGDLFESSVKRRFGVKDTSHVIPGHGGLMDRLDGFIAACGVAALVGVLCGGFNAPARGFLVW
jgi:phosphatidate cytidylyltransferase